jgi:hypothetical protein
MSDVVIPYRFKVLGNTAANLAADTGIAKERELVVEIDTGRMKLGDGSTGYTTLPYVGWGHADFTNLADKKLMSWNASGSKFVPVFLDAVDISYGTGTVDQALDDLIDDMGDTVEEAPIDGKRYGRKDGAWSEITGGGGGAYPEGTSFPAGPSVNDKFYRTDLNLLCYYDGTRWLTVQLFGSDLSMFGSTNTTTNNGGYVAPPPGDFYIESLWWNVRVTGTNNSSNYWTLTAETTDGDTYVAFGNLSTQGLSFANPTAVQLLTTAIGTVISGAVSVRFLFDKVGSPGGVYYSCRINWRLVIT